MRRCEMASIHRRETQLPLSRFPLLLVVRNRVNQARNQFSDFVEAYSIQPTVFKLLPEFCEVNT
jgi:hypothetical protein